MLSDVHAFLQSLRPLVTETTPLFLMGSSMGGGKVLYYVLHPDSPYATDPEPPRITGLMAYAPLVALHPSTRPWSVTMSVGRMLGKVMPKFRMSTAINPNFVSRDPQVREMWIKDPLRYAVGTLEGMAGMLDRALWLEGLSKPSEKATVDRLKSRLPASIWLCHGTGDQINSYDATKELAATLEGGDVTFQTYEDGHHKLDGDLPDVSQPFKEDVAKWILARTPAAALPEPSAGVKSNI